MATFLRLVATFPLMVVTAFGGFAFLASFEYSFPANLPYLLFWRSAVAGALATIVAIERVMRRA